MKHIIYSSDINISDWLSDKDEIMYGNEICKDCKVRNCKSCYGFYEECERLNEGYLEDDKDNLNVSLDNYVIALADLGLWNGRKPGYKMLSKNLSSIFDISGDRVKYYDDGRNIRGECVHHDGTNYILYRKLKSNVSVEQIERILYKNNYSLNSNQISRYTESLRPYVAEVYGW